MHDTALPPRLSAPSFAASQPRVDRLEDAVAQAACLLEMDFEARAYRLRSQAIEAELAEG